jgi:hypothetical protein
LETTHLRIAMGMTMRIGGGRREWWMYYYCAGIDLSACIDFVMKLSSLSSLLLLLFETQFPKKLTKKKRLQYNQDVYNTFLGIFAAVLDTQK